MHDLINAAKIKAGALLISTSLISLTIGSLTIYKTSHPTDWGTHISFSTITVLGAGIVMLGGIVILIEGCLGKSFFSLWKHRTCSPPSSNATERSNADGQQSTSGDIQPSESVVPPNGP
jgi:hypothetical protein